MIHFLPVEMSQSRQTSFLVNMASSLHEDVAGLVPEQVDGADVSLNLAPPWNWATWIRSKVNGVVLPPIWVLRNSQFFP